MPAVLEVVNTVNPKTGQRIYRLFRHQTWDWHGPTDMTIPIKKAKDKICIHLSLFF